MIYQKTLKNNFLINNLTQFILKRNQFKFDMNFFVARKFSNRALMANKCDTVTR